MSTTIDEKVVEMRFDNKNFESNVQTSISTLDKLKQKLNLSGASKGLENLDSAAKNVNMNALGSAVETVQARFSALEVMGVTALANIANSAINTGKRMLSALTIDPIRTGFNEYETKMNSVQTIMSNTASKGTTMEDVTNVLDELNTYADKTIYNFQEMTRNIGTFTAAGVGLEESASAIQGIANLAAASGSNSQQASTAMYQLSQALAAGTVKLMDWNSVVNAGMGGEKFQEALKSTAREMGISVDSMIKKHGSFRESLTEGWITADVLNTTLKKFTKEGAAEYADAMVKSGKYTKEQAEALMKEAQSMEDAATKVKTFTQLWDTMKESVQSGWATTWELIIGDFEEAKELLSGISDWFGNIIGKFSDRRNNLLQGALGKNFSDLKDKVNGFLKPVKEAVNTVQNVKSSISDLGDVVNDVIIGKFGDGKDRINALNEAGQNYYRVQNKVNEVLGYSFRYTDKQIEDQDKLLGKQEKTTEATSDAAKEISKLTEEEKNRIKVLANMAEEQLESEGYTKEQIAAFKELGDTAKKLGIPLNDFIDNMDEIDGRWLLWNSLKNVGKSIATVFSSIGKAWRETFESIKPEQLFNAIAAIHRITSKVFQSINSKSEELTRTFKGLFALIDIITTIVGGGFKLAFKVVSKVLSAFNMDILDLTAKIGDIIVKFRDWLFENGIVAKGIEKTAIAVKMAIDFIAKWISIFIKLPAVQRFIESFKNVVVNGFDSAKEAVSNFIKGINDGSISLKTIGSKFVEIGKSIIQGLINGIKNNSVIDFMIEIGQKIIGTIKKVLGIHSPSRVMFDIGKNIVIGLFNGIKSAISFVLSYIKDIGSNIIGTFATLFDKIPWDKLINIGIVVVLLNFVKKISDAFKAVSNVANGFGDILGGVGNILNNSAKGIGKILKNTAKVVKSFSKVLNSIAFKNNAEGVKTLAISLAILAASIIALTFIDPDKLKESVKIIAILAGILLILSAAMALMSKASASISKDGIKVSGVKTSLLAIGAAILLMGLTLKSIGSLNEDQYKQGLKGLFNIILMLLSIVAAYGLLVKGKSAQNIDKAGKMFMKLSIAFLLLTAVAKIVGKTNSLQLAKGIGVITAFGLIITGLIAATKLAGNKINSVGSTIIKISAAMAIMAHVAKSIGQTNALQLVKGIGVIAAFGLIITGLIAATKLVSAKDLAGLGATLLSVSASILIMAMVIKLVGNIDPNPFNNGILIIGELAAIVAGLVLITKLAGKDAGKIAATLLALSTSIAILASMAVLLGLVNQDNLDRGVDAIVKISAMMALLMLVTYFAKDCKSSLLAMTAVIAMLTASVAALSFINPDKLTSAVEAMSVLMIIFSIALAVSGLSKGATGSILAMTGAILVISGVLLILTSMLDDVNKAIKVAIMLGGLMIALAATMALLKFAGGVGSAVALLVLSVSLIAISGALLMLAGIPFESLAGGLIAIAIGLALIVGTVALLEAFAIGAGMLVGVLLSLAAVVLSVSVAALAFAGALYIAAIALPLLADGLELLVIKLAGCSSYAGGFLKTMLAVSAGMAVMGLAAVIASAGLIAIGAAIGVALAAVAVGVAALGVGLVVVAAALVVGSIAAILFGAALYIVAGALPLIAKGITTLVTSVASCQAFMETFTAVMSSVGTAILALLSKIGLGLTILGLGAIVAAAGAVLLAVGVTLLSVAILTGAVAVLALSAAFKCLGESLNVITDAVEAGANLIAGFAQGIAGGITTVVESVKSVAQSAVNGIKNFLGIHSPSTVAQELGKYFGDGFALGIDDSTGNVESSAEDLGSAAKDSMGAAGSEGGASFTDGIGEGIDLSSVDMGSFDMSSINSMMSGSGSEGGASFTSGVSDGIDLSSIDIGSLGGEGVTSMFGGLGTESGESFNSGLSTEVDSASMNDTLDSMLNEASSKNGEFKTAGQNVMKAFKSGVDSSKSSIAPAMQKVILNVVSSINGVGSQAFRGSGIKLITSFKEGIDTSKASISSTMKKTILSAESSINGVGTQAFKSAGNRIMDALESGMNRSSNSLTISLQKQIKNSIIVVNKIGLTGFRNAGKNVVESFRIGFIQTISRLNSAVSMMIKTALNSIQSKLPSFMDSGRSIMSKVIEGMNQKKSALSIHASVIASSASSAIKNKFLSFYESGTHLGSGLVQGINSKKTAAYNAGYALGQMAAQGEKDGQKSNSPSKLTIQNGKWLGEGLIIGIQRMTKSVYDAGYGIGETATNPISEAISKISDYINSDIDSQPTIRPVLDLSDVQSGADAISGLLNKRVSVGATASVDSISSRMNERIQNGRNDDVVSAINKLSTKLDNAGGSTNIINGITYDDGSNISDAIQSLVRAARVERRV